MRVRYLEYLLDCGEQLKRCSTCKNNQIGICNNTCKLLGFLIYQDNGICDKYKPSWKVLKYIIKESIKKEKLLKKEDVNYREI